MVRFGDMVLLCILGKMYNNEINNQLEQATQPWHAQEKLDRIFSYAKFGS